MPSIVWPARLAILAVALGAVTLSNASEPGAIRVTLHDHRFSPAEFHVAANQPTLLEVVNLDPLPEEFDSPDLKVEKVIAAGQTGLIRLRPLKPGRYAFSGEYHAGTAQGAVLVP